MKKVKVLSIVLIMMMLVIAISTPVFATGDIDSIITNIKTNADDNMKDPTEGGNISVIAGKIVGIIQFASVIATIILVAVFGFMFIMGSAEEKKDYQKKFIPLFVGLVVVFAATTIGKLLLSTASSF